MGVLPQNFLTHSLRLHPRRDSITRILSAAIRSADAGEAVKNFLHENPLPPAKRVFAFGLGKAAPAMTSALADILPLTNSLLVTKHASGLNLKAGEVIAGNHPIPGADSLAAGRAARKFVSRLTPDDLLICLISGGGSALMAEPLIPLEELQALTSALLASGASIHEVNTVRRHLDSLKGGGMVQAANGARIVSLILSDVVGDSLETIVSGPTAPDPSTVEDARAVVDRIANSIPQTEAGQISNLTYKFRETPKPGDSVFERVSNHIIASNGIALEAAKRQANAEGFFCEVIETNLQGEAREVGQHLSESLVVATRSHSRPFCLLAGGETTVTVRGNGRGGRNQELALAAVESLRGVEDAMLVSLATDGEDGPTDAAGAVVTGKTSGRAESLAMASSAFLSANDAYSFFASLGDLIQPGPSGTNVNDLVLMFAF